MRVYGRKLKNFKERSRRGERGKEGRSREERKKEREVKERGDSRICEEGGTEEGREALNQLAS